MARPSRKRSWLSSIFSIERPFPPEKQTERSKRRGAALALEILEDRIAPATVTGALTPNEVANAYGINHILYGNTTGNGAGQTIAIIDPGDDSALVNTGSGSFDQSDLHIFDQQMGLPDPPSFSVVNESGGSRPVYPGIESTSYTGTTVTVTVSGTTAGDGIANGDFVTIAETGNSNVDGYYQVSNVTATTFQYTDNNSNLTTTSGGTLNNPIDTGETTLDVEWAHAIAPQANIVLIELTNSWTDLNTALTVGVPAVSPNIVTMSFGFAEGSVLSYTGSTIATLDADFAANKGVAFLASSGDNGTPVLYPSSSPDVLAIGGTNLFVDGNLANPNTGTFSYESEVGWSNPTIFKASESGNTVSIITSDTTPTNFRVGDTVTIANVGVSGYDGTYTVTGTGPSANEFTYTIGGSPNALADSTGGTAVGANNGGSGGGASAVELQPSYQKDGTVTSVSNTNRTTPDVSFVGGEPTPVYTYDSDGTLGSFHDYYTFNTWGTSLSSPAWAGLVAIADQGLAMQKKSPLDTPLAGGATLQTDLYNLTLNDFHDITSGNNGFAAGVGYDFVTGIGSPIANLLVPDLADEQAELVYNVPDNAGIHYIEAIEDGAKNIDIYASSTSVGLVSPGNLVATHPASTTSQIDINGSDAPGIINLTVDFSGGQFTVPVNYNAGTGVGTHSLTIQSGSFTNEVDTATGHTMSGYNSGTVTLDLETITYSQIMPMTDTSTAINYTINGLGGSDETFDITTSSAQTQVSGSDFETVDFANKTNVTVESAANLASAGPSTFTDDLTAANGIASLTLNGGTAGGSSFDVEAAEPGSMTLTVVGGGTGNTLTGPNLADTWDITGSLAGNVGTTSPFTNVVTSFTDIANLIGGTSSDFFLFSAGAIMGSIDGGTGSNTIQGPAGKHNDFEITGSNSGFIIDDTDILTILNSFKDVQNLEGGGGGIDAFIFGTSGALTGTITGEPTLAAADSAVIDGPDLAETWIVSGDDAGNIGSVSPFTNLDHAFVNVGKLSGGTAADTFKFTASSSQITSEVNGGSGTNTILNASGDEYTWDITGTNSGSIGTDTHIAALVTGASPPPDVVGVVKEFFNIQDLTGGSVLDVFHFAGGSVTGTITGGSGSEWLDYSAITTSVTVNLGTGVATSTGGVSGVNNVIGSTNGGDTLTGDAAGGVLVGHNNGASPGNTITAGAGRSVIIGGAGVNVNGQQNQLTGGTGDDLLIDGHTVFDANPTALAGILTEWVSGATFNARVAALQAGIVVTGAGTAGDVVALVVNDGAHPTGTIFLSTGRNGGVGPRFGHGGGAYATTLTGGKGHNWFITLSGYDVANFKSGDILTTS